MSAEEEAALRHSFAFDTPNRDDIVPRLLATLDAARSGTLTNDDLARAYERGKYDAGPRDEDGLLREAAKAVLDHAEPDDNFEGEYIDWLVPHEQIEALRAALRHEPVSGEAE